MNTTTNNPDLPMNTATNDPNLQVVREDTNGIKPLMNMMLGNINSIVELYGPVKKHLSATEKKYLKQLILCSIILNEK